MVVGTTRIHLPAQLDNGRVVDVVPLNPRPRIEPEHPRVKAAAEVHHRAVRVNGQELSNPDVELRGADREQRRPLGTDAQGRPVEVDPVNRSLGVPVPENRMLEISVECLEVQRRQHGLRRAAQVDGNSAIHTCESMRSGFARGDHRSSGAAGTLRGR